MNASVHWHTPSLAVIGPRGEAVRQVDYLRRVAGEDVQALIARQQYDVAGRLVALRDPRLPTPNSTMVHRLDGMAVKTHNVDVATTLCCQVPAVNFCTIGMPTTITGK